MSQETKPTKGQPKIHKRCEHGRRKTRCKECVGSGICEHGRLKARCKECGGSEICEHGRRKAECKECGGSSICEHGRRKAQCKECRGSSICEHGRMKATCKECGGSSICEHGRQKAVCKECGGSSICEHGRPKTRCKECGGSSICEHGRMKATCKECGGSGICKHGRQKAMCKECVGSGICEHQVQKRSCKHCGIKCSSCQLNVVRKKDAQCSHCLPVAKHRSRCKEARIAAELGGWASEGYISMYTSWNKANPDANRAICGAYRPDFIWDLQFRAVILEVDEFQHKYENYVRRCELVRVSRIVEGFGGIPVHILRYNPDAFKITGVTRTTRYNERVELLKIHLTEALARPDFEHRIVVQHLWFDQDQDTMEFVTTQRFKTLEDYEAWVEQVEPSSTGT